MTRAPENRPVDAKAAALMVLITTMWGGNVVAIKYGLFTFPPMWSAFWRFLSGLPVIWALARVMRVPLAPEPEEREQLKLLGLLFFAQLAVLNLGLNFTSAAYAIVLLNANPVFTNLLAHYFVPGDRLTSLKLAGLAVSVAAVSFAFLGRPEARLASAPLLGNSLCLLAAFLVAARLVYTKRLVATIEPIKAIFWQVVWSQPLFLAAALAFEPMTLKPVESGAVAAILYQGVIVAGGCFIAWTLLLRRHPAGALSVFAFPTPIFGVLFSAALFGERIGFEVLAGGVGVALGILIATWTPGRRLSQARRRAAREAPGAQAPSAPEQAESVPGGRLQQTTLRKR